MRETGERKGDMLLNSPSGFICNTNGAQWKQQVQDLKVTYGPEQVSLRVLSKQKQDKMYETGVIANPCASC